MDEIISPAEAGLLGKLVRKVFPEYGRKKGSRTLFLLCTVLTGKT